MTEETERGVSQKTDFLLLGAFLALGLIHGLIYVLIVPPWQHYDEPTHFEVVWLTAKLGRHPTAEDYDPVFSREVIQSMVDHGFYAGLPYSPDLSTESDVHIFGYQQFQEQPLYYYLAALPLRFYQSEDVANELCATRLVSVVLFLATIIAAWGIVRTITPPGHLLRWMVPAFIVLLPAFTDLMSAVNNDVLAIAAFSFFLWGAARLLKSGYNFINFTWVVASMALVYCSKNTAYVAFALLPLVLVIALIPKQYRWIGWIASLLIGVVGLGLSLSFDDAAFWHRTTAQRAPLRQANAQAIIGNYVMALDSWERTNPPWAPPSYQLVPLFISQYLKERPLTLGFWIWANQPVTVNTPNLGTPLMQAGERIQVNQAPSFHAFHVVMPPSSIQMWVSIRPQPDQQKTRLFFDGFLLVDGHRPLDVAPEFDDADGSHGTWGGEQFTNYIHNGSFEHTWPRVKPRLDNFLTRILPDEARPTLILHSILDWPATQLMFKQTYRHMMQTFWARFGWGHVTLSWPVVYRILEWAFWFGIVGAFIGAIRHFKTSSWDWALLLFLSAALIWFANFVRGVGYFTSNDYYTPPARYAFPAIIPTAILLTFGWLEMARLICLSLAKLFQPGRKTEDAPAGRSFSLCGFLSASFFLGALIVLVVYSVISIINFYQVIG